MYIEHPSNINDNYKSLKGERGILLFALSYDVKIQIELHYEYTPCILVICHPFTLLMSIRFVCHSILSIKDILSVHINNNY